MMKRTNQLKCNKDGVEGETAINWSFMWWIVIEDTSVGFVDFN